MRVLDLFSGAGGAAHGYRLAGHHVTGVDIAPQPNHAGDQFVQADALAYVAAHGGEFDFIHASPPCQAYSPLNAYNHKDYPDLVAAVRNLLVQTGRPAVIENVPQAPLNNPTLLCGAMFGIPLYRHRAFEAIGWALAPPPHPKHVARCTRNGYLPTAEKPYMSIHGGRHSEAWRLAANAAMGTLWMKTIREVCEAIPPAYTKYVADQFARRKEAPTA